MPRRKGPTFDVARLRRDMARWLLNLGRRYYPGTVGSSLLGGRVTFDFLAERSPDWLRGLAGEIETKWAPQGADPARWERDALALLAGDPVIVPSWALPKWAYDVLRISPAPIRTFRVEADSLTEVRS
jgi:hypothetical protein